MIAGTLFNSNTSDNFWTTRNSSYVIPGVYDLTLEDSNWVLTSSFIIFTMQTGFGMLESGCVSIKNDVNIMIKNIIDMVLGVSCVSCWKEIYWKVDIKNSFLLSGLHLLDVRVRLSVWSR